MVGLAVQYRTLLGCRGRKAQGWKLPLLLMRGELLPSTWSLVKRVVELGSRTAVWRVCVGPIIGLRMQARYELPPYISWLRIGLTWSEDLLP